MERNFKFSYGDIVGSLVFIEETEPIRSGVKRVRIDRAARFRCRCGNTLITLIASAFRGRTTSCGCIKGEAHSKHGAAKRGKRMEEYGIWAGIVARCTNQAEESYSRYVGRGIKICDRWRYSFENFYADMGPRPSKDHSVERIENDGDYEPGNCKWATRHEQGRNKSTNRFIEYNGKRMVLVDWAKELGISRTALSHRLKSGWTIEEAMTIDATPCGCKVKKHRNGQYRPITDKDRAEMVNKLNSGVNYKTICDEYGITSGLLYQIRKQQISP